MHVPYNQTLHRIAREVEKIDHKWRAVRALRRFRSCSERTRATFSQDAREHEVTFIFASFMQNPVQRTGRAEWSF
jgi:hypothetical protein